jgi:signal transduction histidine kinase
MATTANQMAVTGQELMTPVDPAAGSASQTINVLVVEDNAADRNLVRLSLLSSPYQYKLDCAERLSEGLKKLGKQPTDIVLLDLNLPDSQGQETVQRVLAQAPHVPILVLSGSDDDKAAVDAVRAGAQDYIVKGQLDGNVLTRAMRHAIERHQVLTVLRETRQRQLEFKDKFLSHVSHELRSPLACIHQYAELMLEGLAGPLTDKEREYLGNVLRNAKQLNKLLTDLLDAARANVGKLTIEPARVEPAEVVKQLLQMFEPKAKGRGVTLAAQVGANAPAIIGDRERLLQIMINLMDNALKFTPSGGEITIRADVFAGDPEFVQFSVSDTGKGINPENLDRIFDRLYQEQNAVASRQGLGLGLAICKELVDRHGGRIWVDSKVGVGSVFTFTVPMFSLPSVIAPLLLQKGTIHQATLVAVEITRGDASVSEDGWEFGRRRCREVVERCILPDKDLLLPSMHSLEGRDLLFILACADSAGASVLETRIRGQLAASRQVLGTCECTCYCVPLPRVPAGMAQPAQQLEWLSEKIESAILQIGQP